MQTWTSVFEVPDRETRELMQSYYNGLKAGESKTVHFQITINDLKFYNSDLKYVAEPGDFKLFIGTNSQDVKEADFKLVK